MKTLALIVPCIAVIIGGINTLAPELWLKIPKIGFIPWAIGGGIMPPFFFFDAFKPENFAGFIHDGDVIVSTQPKAGTNWMLYTLHQIRTKGTNDPPFVEQQYNTPWLSLRHKPGQSWEEISDLMNNTILPDGVPLKDRWDHPKYPFRVFKGHEAPLKEGGGREECLPIEQFPKVKFIGMIRTSRDVMHSFFSFFSTHSDAFKALWGGFPPSYSNAKEVVDDFVPGGKLYHLYFGYVKQWWPYRHHKNVLFEHYNNYKNDPTAFIKKVADFVEVELTSEQVEKIADLTSFEKMKHLQDNFKVTMWGISPMVNALKTKEEQGMFFKSGKAGAGKTFLTPELEEKWSAALKSEFTDPDMMRYAEEGGVLP